MTRQNSDLVFSACRTPENRHRFQKYVSNTPTSDGCILWNGSAGKHGHGVFFIMSSKNPINGFGRKGLIYAHRASLMIFRETKVDNDLCVCHKCDNPRCVNPDHLFIGTQQDNIKDMFEKKRWRGFPPMKGKENPNSKLCEQDIVNIRKSSLSGRQLAKKYFVTPANISSIKSGKTWKHVSTMVMA